MPEMLMQGTELVRFTSNTSRPDQKDRSVWIDPWLVMEVSAQQSGTGIMFHHFSGGSQGPYTRYVTETTDEVIAEIMRARRETVAMRILLLQSEGKLKAMTAAVVEAVIQKVTTEVNATIESVCRKLLQEEADKLPAESEKGIKGKKVA